MQNIGYKRTVQNCVHIVLRTVRTRVIYDRVQNKKNNFEIPAFLNYEQGKPRAGKFKTSNENKNVFGFEYAVDLC